jgi:TetR/AcrR family transcriptional regulator, transcriptional repressor of aconitase
MARLTRQESHQRTRDRLLQAAEVVFAKEGYTAASLDDIAEHAEFSKGAIYSNFESKEALFLAVLSRKMLREQEFYHELVARCKSKQELLQALASWHWHMEDEINVLLMTTEFQMIAGQRPQIASQVARLFRQQRRGLATIFQGPVSKRKTRTSSHSQELATTLLALAKGLALQHAADPKAITERMVERILRQFLIGASSK